MKPLSGIGVLFSRVLAGPHCSTGTMAKMGLDYEQPCKSNPGLVLASISGYGKEGVWRDWRSCAMLVQAEMGYMEGEARYTGREISRYPYAHGALYAGTQCCVGILAALLQRSSSGNRGAVDVDMAESILLRRGQPRCAPRLVGHA